MMEKYYIVRREKGGHAPPVIVYGPGFLGNAQIQRRLRLTSKGINMLYSFDIVSVNEYEEEAAQ